MTNTCFVIMPIGTQTLGDKTITSEDLKRKYDYIIKNAVLVADPSLEVIRADEELNPGSMSNDIFTKLMHSKYVIADITYPNPNVFYELGIRHAISTKTILIRSKEADRVPFDISHLRYVEYTSDPGGMEALASALKTRFAFYDSNPGKPDNQFLELCKFTDYIPDVFTHSKNTQHEAASKIFSFVLSQPDLLNTLISGTEDEKQKSLVNAICKDQSVLSPLVELAIGGSL